MTTTNQLSFDTGSFTAVTAIDRSFVKERLKNTKLHPANIRPYPGKENPHSLPGKTISDPLPEKANAHPFLEKWSAEDATTPIYWQTTSTPVGEILVAATAKGVCFLGFNNDSREQALDDLRMRCPDNPIEEKRTNWHDEAQRHLDNPRQQLPVHLHLKGTDFQLGIWERLLQIPFGGLTTYSELGNGARNARATGSAVGANPVSIILPCHRVVRADGSYEGYYWGPALKTKLLIYESI